MFFYSTKYKENGTRRHSRDHTLAYVRRGGMAHWATGTYIFPMAWIAYTKCGPSAIGHHSIFLLFDNFVMRLIFTF